jgi:hypothetical protein
MGGPGRCFDCEPRRLVGARRVTPTAYFDDFLSYYRKAERLQEMNLASLTGRDVATQQVGDPLMDYVTIYDCVERRYAGFSNALQQIWFGSKDPKQWQADAWFDDCHQRFTELEWLWIFLVHRITGSGASFAHDHGFRNSVVGEMALAADQAGDMKKWLLSTMKERAIFTSIGNQIPAFPKPSWPYARGGELYLDVYAPRLCWDMLDWLRAEKNARRTLPPLTVAQVADRACQLQKSYGLKQFKFVLTAWAMDIAEYMPWYVDPFSHVHYGKNALESLNLMFDGFKAKQVDEAMETIQTAIGGATRPYSLEDVLCDYTRYLEHYIPKGYDHLELWQLENRSTAQHEVRHDSYTNHPARAAGRLPDAAGADGHLGDGRDSS